MHGTRLRNRAAGTRFPIAQQDESRWSKLHSRDPTAAAEHRGAPSPAPTPKIGRKESKSRASPLSPQHARGGVGGNQCLALKKE